MLKIMLVNDQSIKLGGKNLLADIDISDNYHLACLETLGIDNLQYLLDQINYALHATGTMDEYINLQIEKHR